MNSFFVWAGETSFSKGLTIERCPSFGAGQRIVEKTAIPGKSGDLVFDTGAFSNYIQSYEIWFRDKSAGMTSAAKSIATWLLSPLGYQRLEDTYDPDVFRMAVYTGPIEIENWMLTYGRATLDFDCMPQRWLKSGQTPISVQNGDVIRVYLLDDQLGLTSQEGPEFLQARAPAEFIYENDDLIVANKPAGIPVDGDESDTLLNRVLRRLYEEKRWDAAHEPRLCHRLDTGTSGLVIIAKTPEAEELFLSAIKNREVQKTYLCVTFGRPMPPDATLGGYLLKDADRGIVKIVEDKQPGAKEVETRYETIAVSGRLALLKVQLITGRTHQIRAHMASIGCPILGDSKYGNNSANRELKLKYQALCAWELTMPRFTQPDFAFLSGKTFHAPKPWYYQQVLDGTLK